MLKYSFVLPAYKACFFREALDSILNQTYKDFELIIVNDASPEGLDAIVKSYDDPRIRYYENENNIGGKDLVAQWNHCLEYARGEYIILASDDDVYHLEYLEKMDILVQKYPDVNIFRPRVQRIIGNCGIIEIESVIPEYTTLLEFLYLRFKEYIKSGIPFYIIKKSALMENGGFVNYPLGWYADDAIVAIMAQNGMVASREILFSFRFSGESISSKANDSITLRRKIDATNQFYSWLEKYINSINVRGKYLEFYKRFVLDSISGLRKEQNYLWIVCSCTTAIWKNFVYLIKNDIISFKALISLLFRRL